MTGVVHIVDDIVGDHPVDDRLVDDHPLRLATALQDPGRPQLILAGTVDAGAAAMLGHRLRVLPALRAPTARGFSVGRLVGDAGALVDLARVIDTLVDRLRSPVVVQTYGTARTSRAGALGRLAAASIRGVVNVHRVDDEGTRDEATRDEATRDGDEPRWRADVLVFASEAARAQASHQGQTRVIPTGIDPTPYAALLADDAARARTRAELGVAKGAHLVVTNAPAAADAWRARDPRADVVHISGASSSHLGAADVALLVRAPLHDVLAAIAAGLLVLVVDRKHEAELGWAKRVRFLESGGPNDYADALAAAFAAKPLAASTRARHAKLPRELTADGALAAWGELYDELVGPPRPTGEMLRRRPVRRRRSR